jgi:hypothetical protein
MLNFRLGLATVLFGLKERSMSEDSFIAANPVSQVQLTASYWHLAPRIKQIYETLPEEERLPSMWFLSLPTDPAVGVLAAPIPDILVKEVFFPIERRMAFQAEVLHPLKGPKLLASLGLVLSHHPNALLLSAMAWQAGGDEYLVSKCESVAALPSRQEVFMYALRAHQLPPVVGAWPVNRRSEQIIELQIVPPVVEAYEGVSLPRVTVH